MPLRRIGRNDAGIPEDQLCDVIIPVQLPERKIWLIPETGERFDSDGSWVAVPSSA